MIIPNSRLAEIDAIGYRANMSLLLRQIVRYVAQKAASDPEVREKAVRAARGVVEDVKQITGEDDRAFVAGRAVRRRFDKLRDHARTRSEK